MKRTICALLILSIAATLFTGCGDFGSTDESLSGNTPSGFSAAEEMLTASCWALIESEPSGDGQKFNSGFDFKIDGTFVYYCCADISAQPKAYHGGYSLDGSVLTLHFTDGIDFSDYKMGVDEPRPIVIDERAVCTVSIEKTSITLSISEPSPNVWIPEDSYGAVKSISINGDGNISWKK